MWSGGLDSTWLLSKFDKCDVLEIDLINSDGLIRHKLENEAREKIKPLFSHTYYHASLDVSNWVTCTLDTINATFLSAQLAQHLNYSQHDKIWMGANCDDDAVCYSHSELLIKKIAWTNCLKAVYKNNMHPEVAWFDPAPSRLKQLKDLGEIANLTWSCRDPKISNNEYVACGRCKPCRYISKAKREIIGNV